MGDEYLRAINAYRRMPGQAAEGVAAEPRAKKKSKAKSSPKKAMKKKTTAKPKKKATAHAKPKAAKKKKAAPKKKATTKVLRFSSLPALKVDRSYIRWKQLSAYLTEKYEACIVSSTVKRFASEKRRKAYCAAQAWNIARQSGRFSDYPAFRVRKKTKKKKTDKAGERAMAKATKKKGSSKPRKKGRAKPKAEHPKKKKKKQKGISHAKAVKRAEKAARTRKRNKKERSEAAKKGARKKKAKAAHKATPAPKKKKAKKPRATAKPKAAKKKKASSKPRKKGKRGKSQTAAIQALIKGHMRTVNLLINKKTKQVKGSVKKRPKRKKPSTAMTRPHTMAAENPIYGGMENPMTPAEGAFVFVAVGAGYGVSELWHRWANNKWGPSSTLTPAQADVAKPNMQSWIGQAVLVGAAGLGTWKVHNPLGRAILGGVLIGGGAHLAWAVIVHFVGVKLLGSRPTVQKLLGPEIAADAAYDAAKAAGAGPAGPSTTTGGGTASTGMTGPNGQRPYGFARDPGPRAGMGATAAGTDGTTVAPPQPGRTDGGGQPQPPVPQTALPPPPCGNPCDPLPGMVDTTSSDITATAVASAHEVEPGCGTDAAGTMDNTGIGAPPQSAKVFRMEWPLDETGS